MRARACSDELENSLILFYRERSWIAPAAVTFFANERPIVQESIEIPRERDVKMRRDKAFLLASLHPPWFARRRCEVRALFVASYLAKFSRRDATTTASTKLPPLLFPSRMHTDARINVRKYTYLRRVPPPLTNEVPVINIGIALCAACTKHITVRANPIPLRNKALLLGYYRENQCGRRKMPELAFHLGGGGASDT